MSSIVQSVTGGLGGNSGGAGLNYNASGTAIQSPVTSAQAQTAYDQSQAALAQQQQFLAATQAQNGLGNQTSVYNQLQGITNGTGPNPAQAQLAQATGANVAAQNALMAGQRGSGSNVGLLARQAAQQGAATQQQAVGQAGTLQANQSLNALNSQGAIATNQANQQANATQAYNTAAQGEQANLLNSIAGVNSANVNMQSNINAQNAGISAIAAKDQGSILSGISGALGGAAQMAQGGQVPQRFDSGGMPTPLPPPAASTALVPSTGPKHALGQMMQGAYNGFQASQGDNSPSAYQQGQQFGQMARKGFNSLFGSSSTPASTDGLTAPGSQSLDTLATPGGGAANDVSQNLAGGVGDMDLGSIADIAAAKGGEVPSKETQCFDDGGGVDAATILKLAPVIAGLNEGGKVPALVSPGETYLPPRAVKEVAAKGKDPIEAGERVPGKPKVKGNSYKNDIVPAKLEPGGIVIPNSVMQSKKPHWEAMKFVHATLAKNGKANLKKRGQ